MAAHAIHRVEHFDIVGPYTLALRFADGTEQLIDFQPVLEGEMFGPLKDQKLFNAVALDQESGTLTWPNGADFDPATLHDWPQISRRADLDGPRLGQAIDIDASAGLTASAEATAVHRPPSRKATVVRRSFSEGGSLRRRWKACATAVSSETSTPRALRAISNATIPPTSINDDD